MDMKELRDNLMLSVAVLTVYGTPVGIMTFQKIADDKTGVSAAVETRLKNEFPDYDRNEPFRTEGIWAHGKMPILSPLGKRRQVLQHEERAKRYHL
jgi:hypothetical protein